MDDQNRRKRKNRYRPSRRRQAKKEKQDSEPNASNNGNGPNNPKKNSRPNFSNGNPFNNGPNNPRKNNDNSLYDGDADVTVVGIKDTRRCENWNEMDFDKQLLKNIKDCGYIKPRKVQEVVLPYLAEGYDFECQSETGNGKTAAYLIPLIDNLIKEKQAAGKDGLDPDGPHCLIIAPTREFVQQIYYEAIKLTYKTGITVAAAYGGVPVKNTLKNVSKGCNILCACLGRLLNIMKHGNAKFENLYMSNVKYIVIDEADHFLLENQKVDLLHFFHHEFLPKDIKRQLLFFSATLQLPRLCRLSNEFVDLKKRVHITSALESNQRIKYIIDLLPSADAKFLCLTKRVSDISAANGGKCPRIMVFVNQKVLADSLTEKLTLAGFPAVVMHSNYSQDEREEALYSFKDGDSDARILVSVNACGRGIDIAEMDYVINYILPVDEHTFIQRCGRTGRTKNGTAISFYVEAENRASAPWIRKVLQRAQHDIPNFLQPNSIEASMAKLSVK